MTEQRTRRQRADRYALLRIGDETPLTPDMVRKMLDEIPSFSDIVEMTVSENTEPFATRRVAIYYRTPQDSGRPSA